MKQNTECKYGYKISYTKPPRKEITDRFLTRSFKEALYYKSKFIQSPEWGVWKSRCQKEYNGKLSPYENGKSNKGYGEVSLGSSRRK